MSSTTSPLVSVILPTRNRAGLLGRAIGSVLRQTHDALELIVVDDASDDATQELLRGLGDPRLRTIRLPTARGAAAARNRGLQEARGSFVAFQDSDDEWRPEKLAVQLRALAGEPGGASVSVCSYRHHKGARPLDVIHRAGVLGGDEVIRRIVHGASPGTVTLLVSRDAIEAAGGFDESLPRSQDVELCLRLAAHGRFVYGPEILVDVYDTEDSISADPDRFQHALAAIVAKHPEVFRRHPRGHSYQLYRAGKYQAFHGRYRAAVPLLVESMRRDARNWRSLVMLGSICLGLVPVLKSRRRHS